MVCLTPAARPATRDPRELLHGLHVLIADDEEGPRELFRDVLEIAGARVTVAASARAALAAIERDVPDVLVSDIMMPGEDGYWLIEAVRALPTEGRRRLRALAITGDPRHHSRERVRAAGFDAHLSKPVGVDILCVAVARLAGRFEIPED
jgi:CheY-like chemotaxis protein